MAVLQCVKTCLCDPGGSDARCLEARGAHHCANHDGPFRRARLLGGMLHGLGVLTTI